MLPSQSQYPTYSKWMMMHGNTFDGEAMRKDLSSFVTETNLLLSYNSMIETDLLEGSMVRRFNFFLDTIIKFNETILRATMG